MKSISCVFLPSLPPFWGVVVHSVSVCGIGKRKATTTKLSCRSVDLPGILSLLDPVSLSLSLSLFACLQHSPPKAFEFRIEAEGRREGPVSGRLLFLGCPIFLGQLPSRAKSGRRIKRGEILVDVNVRMAERSKAPDSRAILPEHSGPHLWAWVRIPLLTNHVLGYAFRICEISTEISYLFSWGNMFSIIY